MNFCLAHLPGVTLGLATRAERFWGLGEAGLAVVLFLTVFLIIVVGWLLHNTGRWD